MLSISSMAVHPVNSSASESIHCSAPRMAFTHVIVVLLHADYIVIGGKCAFAMLFDRCVLSVARFLVMHHPPSHASLALCSRCLRRSATTGSHKPVQRFAPRSLVGDERSHDAGHSGFETAGSWRTPHVTGEWCGRLHWEVEGC